MSGTGDRERVLMKYELNMFYRIWFRNKKYNVQLGGEYTDEIMKSKLRILCKCSYFVEINESKWIVRKIINARISVTTKRRDT